MGRRLRCYEPGAVYESTIRTRDARFLLRPDAAVNAIILSVIARGLHLFPDVSLHYFTTMSNHLHMLLSTRSGDALAGFFQFVNGTLSRKILEHHGISGPLWSGRVSVIRVVGENAMLDRLRYQLAHGCKEGLVATPADWPGASAYPAFNGGTTLEGVWHDRDGETHARASNPDVDPAKYLTTHPIALAPLPVWRGLSACALRSRHRQLVDAVVRETRVTNRRLRRSPLGVAAVLAQDPFFAPLAPKRSPAPICHASTPEARASFVEARELYTKAYRRASAAVRTGAAPVAFPPGSFPCRARWTPFHDVAPPSASARAAPG